MKPLSGEGDERQGAQPRGPPEGVRPQEWGPVPTVRLPVAGVVGMRGGGA